MINRFPILVLVISSLGGKAHGINNPLRGLYQPTIRGGSTSLLENQTLPDSEDDEIIVPQKSMKSVKRRIHSMDADRVALALRLTCELNRRSLAHTFHDDYTIQRHAIFNNADNGQSKNQKKVVFDLEKYIHSLYTIFDYENVPFIPALTMLYLDRACSAETPRIVSSDGSVPCTCPILHVKNIHKLYFVANILAIRAFRHQIPVDGNYHDTITGELYQDFQKSSSMDMKQYIGDISLNELGNMLEWMVASMGSRGLAVSLEEVNKLILNFSNLFQVP
jgi:hypothetical protein